ncbi:MAG: TIGR03790 family protein, partial [Thermoplasmata archaeon]
MVRSSVKQSKSAIDPGVKPLLILLSTGLILLFMALQVLNGVETTTQPSQGMEADQFRDQTNHDSPNIPDIPSTSTRSQPEYYEYISYDDVLVIRNLNSPLSMQIADYFISKRNIPAINVCNITAPTGETINRDTFNNTIKIPVEQHIIDNQLGNKINYMVTTKGVPLRISSNTHTWDRACVDSDLALILGLNQAYIGQPYWCNNPYFNIDPFEEFSAVKYQFFIVTRLTGYDFGDIKALVDKPEIAIGRHGTFSFDVDPGKDDGGGYQEGNDWMRNAHAILTANGFDSYLDETNTFLTNRLNTSGYTSWGSNDANYPKNSLLNSGLENDGNGDDVPDNWYFENDDGVGICERNGTEVRNGAWSVRIERLTTSGNSSYVAQNYTVKPNTRYYAVGYVNLSGVSSEGGVQLQFAAHDSQGSIIKYYNGSARTGTTTSWVSLSQVRFEPIEGVENISLGVAFSKSTGTVFIDDIYLYEIKPHNDWIPGSLAETYVSTGGRSFNYGTAYGQSLVADLIRDGVTGVKGYVYEPYLSACAHPDILFDAYTQGFRMADSYYMASAYLSWMDCVIGDPKVSPYDLDIVPDLTVNTSDISFSNPGPLSGESINIHANVRNLGLAPAYGVEVRFFLDDPGSGSVYLGNSTVDVNGSNENSTSISWESGGYLGYYNITVVVDTTNRYYESNEGNNMANNTVTVHDGYPVADAGSDAQVDEDESHMFDGSGSTSNSSIINYTWDFGDGDFGYGLYPSHSYTLSGLYAVTLNVTNDWGVKDTDTMYVNVSNVRPEANAGGDRAGDEGIAIEFSASLSSDTPSDTATLNYTWYFGDGSVGYGITVTHTYPDNDLYILTLEVEDDDGAVDTDMANVTVSNLPPAITSVPAQTLFEDTSFELQINATDVMYDTIHFYDNSTLFDIDFVTGFITFTPQNADVGVHIINISVSDDDGGQSSIQLRLDIFNTNDPPYITSEPGTIAIENTLYRYDVVVEDDDFLIAAYEVITYGLDSAPQGMTINETGSITWIPQDEQAQLTFDITVNVSDGEEFDLQMYELFVTNINDDPIINSSPITTATEDVMYFYDVNATDVDSQDTITFSL